VGVAFADLNGDFKPEVVTANQTDGTVSVFPGDGDGTLGGRRDYGVGPGPIAVAVADLNGDRAPDLATANFDGDTVSVLANRGDGTFHRRRNYEAGEDSPDGLAVGDLNGDRKPDLAVASGDADSGTFSLLRNATGLCVVPNVRGKKLPAGRRAISRAGCRVGTVRGVYSSSVKRGRVISQRPKPGAVLSGRGKVDLVVSLGRKR
jgi:hypothetical protein